MARHNERTQGFVLIGALLLLFLLSGVAVGIMMMTTSEIRIGGNDREANVAYYGAESGMEKLTSDLAALYDSKQAPSSTDIQSLTTAPPNSAMVGQMTYAESIVFPVDVNGNPAKPTSQVISSGPNQGLTALIIPMTLTVNSLRPSNASANITRNVEVALIPVFQFGMFSSGDLNFSNGAVFAFGGRVHTNGNLFITPQNGGTTVFGDKITAVGEVMRDPMENSYPPGSSYNGNAYMPNASGGCTAAITANPPRAPLGSETNCVGFTPSSASWLGGMAPGSGSANSTWVSTSTVSFNGYIGNPRSTGVKPLVLPFVQGGGSQIDIIRRPLPGEAATSAVGTSRLYNKANIRILMADTLANLHTERGTGALDAEDVNITATSNAAPKFGGDAVAWADPAVDATWKAPLSVGAATTAFPLVTGWIRVEYRDAGDVWHGVTNEWLNMGIGRAVTPPNTPNPVAATGPNPNAILVFQEYASNNTVTTTRTAIGTGTSWYPINFYDTREGQLREVRVASGLAGASNCTINGLMNAVEIDTGNLKKWIKGTTGVNGPNVEYDDQNGYVLYYSDRRGMLPNPRANASDNSPANILTGEYGFEAVINNASSTTGLPIGTDNSVPTSVDAGEDINGSGVIDTWGAANVGDGFRILTTAAGYPYVNVDCLNQGRMNRVTGARHVLRLTDGTVGNLPLSPKQGGFTVASENPVYVFGDYNAGGGQGVADAPIVHSPAAILADAVTMLSNSWNDINDMTNASDTFARVGTTTYYRTAVAGGKNIAFPNTAGANNVSWGTDGGVHNFLRYLEDWNPNGGTLWYSGSLVSLYPSQYSTGIYKFGASAVYNAPNRKYSFDLLFLNPATLPPATPMFQDIVNLTYRQDFTPY